MNHLSKRGGFVGFAVFIYNKDVCALWALKNGATAQRRFILSWATCLHTWIVGPPHFEGEAL